MPYSFDQTPIEIAGDGREVILCVDFHSFSIRDICSMSLNISTDIQTLDITAFGDHKRNLMAGPIKHTVTIEIDAYTLTYGGGNIIRPVIDRLSILQLLKIAREKLENRG